MRDQLVQTPLPPPSPLHPPSRRVDARMAAGGWLANGHKRVEKLDRETLAAHRGRAFVCRAAIFNETSRHRWIICRAGRVIMPD